MKVALLSEKQRIDHVFSLADKLDANEETISHWARYLCILTSGLIENSVRIMISHYAASHSHSNIANYVKKHSKSISNLNSERLKQLLGAFSDEWCSSFELALTDEQKDAIDSINANRNSISHGRAVGVTLVRIRNYYGKIHEVLKWICEECILK